MAQSLYAHHWNLDQQTIYLNHGSFGACPHSVLAVQSELRQRMEANAVHFLIREVNGLLNDTRRVMAEFVGAEPEELAFIINATSGVNTILRSLQFTADDEILLTNHEYNACSNAVHFVARQSGANVVVADIPLPVACPDDVIEAILSKVTNRTKLLLIDHITSPSALVLPVKEIVQELNRRGVDTLVDGAHAIGMLNLDLTDLGAAYYTGNCHKWLCTPKGSALLYVRRDKQEGIRPLVISHGANSPLPDRTFFHNEFDWTGTQDPTAFLCIQAAISFLEGLMPGGWQELRNHNRTLLHTGRDILLESMDLKQLCPDSMLGMMISLEIPSELPALDEFPGWDYTRYQDPLEQLLFEEYDIVVPVIPWQSPQKRMIRISAQAYNDQDQYVALATALKSIFRK